MRISDWSSDVCSSDLTGRAIGVIDTLQIVDVARAAALFARRDAPGYAAIRAGVEGLFAAYLAWRTTSRFGTEERYEDNNHGRCWLLQAASLTAAHGRGTVSDLAAHPAQPTILPPPTPPA